MGQPAAKQNDQIFAIDTHIIQISTPGGPVPTPLPHPFNGIIDGELSSDVMIEGLPAATVDSTATNTPSHIPQGGPFQTPPDNRATIKTGSSTVTINGKAAARALDTAQTCDDLGVIGGTVIAVSTVLIGG